MLGLRPEDFFDLQTFSHKQVFDGCEHVWEALDALEGYLLSLPLGRIEGEVSSQAYIENPELLWVEKGAVVEAGAYIAGPCVIGSGTVIRHGAYLRGNILAGNDCVIGHTSEVKNAIFLDGAKAAHFAYVGDSILGNGVNLGAGVKCANLRLDGDPVSLRFKGERVVLGRRKLGAIIGDRAHIGCNAVSNPGTLVGMGAICRPCVNFGGFIPHGSVIRTSEDHFIGSSSVC